MRIRIKFKAESEVKVEINNQDIVNSWFHGCLGVNNEFHDKISNYNISGLLGGYLSDDKNHLVFTDEIYVVVSSNSDEFFNTFLSGLFKNKDIIKGVKVQSVEPISEKMYDGWNYFKTLTPILLRREDKRDVLAIDIDFEDQLRKWIKRFLNKMNINEEAVVEVPKNIRRINKMIKVHGIFNRSTHCQFNIKSSKRVAELLYFNGIGVSRGSGFGMIMKTSSKKDYPISVRIEKMEEIG